MIHFIMVTQMTLLLSDSLSACFLQLRIPEFLCVNDCSVMCSHVGSHSGILFLYRQLVSRDGQSLITPVAPNSNARFMSSSSLQTNKCTCKQRCVLVTFNDLFRVHKSSNTHTYNGHLLPLRQILLPQNSICILTTLFTI